MSDDLSEAFKLLIDTKAFAQNLPKVDFSATQGPRSTVLNKLRNLQNTIDKLGNKECHDEQYNNDCAQNDALVEQYQKQELKDYEKAIIRSKKHKIDLSDLVSAKSMKQHLSEESFNFPNLPILPKKNDIMKLIRDNPVIILSGSTGSGKSCLIPQFIVEDSIKNNLPCRIAITQPRRIAAISLCRFVCEMLKVPIGSLVGYKIANEKMSSPESAIIYMTTGVIIQQLVNQKNLDSFSHIIIDEVHERDQNIDFILLIIRRLLRTVSPTTKIIMMSATIERNIFSNYFSCLNADNELIPCHGIEIIAKPYDIQVYYEDDIGFVSNTDSNSNNMQHNVFNQVCLKNLQKILKIIDIIESYESENTHKFRFDVPSKHAMLIFLPGMAEIEDAYSILKSYNVNNNSLEIYRLHSQISNEDQQMIFKATMPNFRKIILATNIAESSITIQDIVYVIDFCLTKELVLNEKSNYAQLQLQWASKASLEQRKGRAGRVKPGIVWRMITRSFYENLSDHPVPEIRRCPLEQTILKTKIFDMGEPICLLSNLLSPPSFIDVKNSILRLKKIGALSDNGSRFDGNLTFIGEIMAKLPIDPTLSKLCIVGFAFGVFEECITLAAILSVKSIFSFDINDKLQSYKSKLIWSQNSKSDLISHLNAYNAWLRVSGGGSLTKKSRIWCKQELLNERRMHEIRLLRENLSMALSRIGMDEIWNIERTHPCFVDPKRKIELLKFVIAGAFYPHYFKMRPSDTKSFEKSCNGKDPFTTIYLHGLPMNDGKKFERSIVEYSRQFGNVKSIDFDCTKCYIELSHEKNNDSLIPLSIYFAIKDRHIRSKNSSKIKSIRPTVILKSSKLIGQSTSQTNIKNSFQSRQDPLPAFLAKTHYNHVNLPDSTIKFLDIIIVNVISPILFWAQYESNNFQQAISFIQETLNKFGGSDHRHLLKMPTIGDRVLYRNIDQNNRVCRGIVTKVSMKDMRNQDGACEIFSVDYGSSHKLHFSELMVPPPNIFSLKYQCFLVQIVDLEIQKHILDNVAKCEEANKFIWNLIKNSIQHLQIDRVQDGRIYADICFENPKTTNMDNLAKILIDSNLCYENKAHNKTFTANDYLEHDSKYSSSNRNMINGSIFSSKFFDITSDDSIKNDKNYGKDIIQLDGPYSVLESNFYPIFGTKFSCLYNLYISNFSVNSVVLDYCFDNDKITPIMVTNNIKSTNSNYSCEENTIFLNENNLLGKIIIIFSPNFELVKYNDQSQQYYGIESKIHENSSSIDIDINFNEGLSVEDVDTANELRDCMNKILKSTDDKTELGSRILFHSQSMIVELQDILLSLYLKLISKTSTSHIS